MSTRPSTTWGAARARATALRPRVRRSLAGLLARMVALVAPAAYLLVMQSGAKLDGSWVGLGLLGIAVARWPDSHVPQFVWGLLVVVWVVFGPPELGWAFAGAAVALLGHTAAAFLAGAPGDVTPTRPLAWRWALRLVAVLAATAAVAVAEAAISGLAVGGWVALTTAVLLGLAGWFVLMRSRSSTW